jgi:hypothetical protein
MGGNPTPSGFHQRASPNPFLSHVSGSTNGFPGVSEGAKAVDGEKLAKNAGASPAGLNLPRCAEFCGPASRQGPKFPADPATRIYGQSHGWLQKL